MSTAPSHVLVTGATGFIGAHVVDVLLQRGVKVTGTARSESKAFAMKSQRARYADNGKFTIIITGDLTRPNAFDEAVKDVDAIIHTASPVLYHGLRASPGEQIVIPAIKGTQSVLQSASKNRKIKRIVITSSFASVINANIGSSPGFTYTSADWNPITYDECINATEGFIGYRGAKKFAELEAWNYVRNPPDPKAPPSFDIVTFCPPVVIGPLVHPVDALSELNLSMEGTRDIVLGADPLPTATVAAWVDVRDLALAHVEALFRPEVGNRRYLPAAPEKFTYQRAADIIRQEFPSWALDVVTKGDEGAQIPDIHDLDGKPVSEDLGIKYRGFRESIVDTVGQLREMAVREASTSSQRFKKTRM